MLASRDKRGIHMPYFISEFERKTFLRLEKNLNDVPREIIFVPKYEALEKV